MLGFDKFFENKTLMFSAGAVAFLVAALLILFIFRLAFGRRLHMPGGGRTRQPRLGVVDAFDLDRQRQLVLVRRDNVEHLVMIGGPNDVLIESQIVRAEAREAARPRDKEPTVSPLSWPAGQAQPPAPPQPSTPPPSLPAEPKLVPEEPVAARELPPPPAQTPAVAAAPTPAVVPAAPAAAPTRPPFLPLPPRRTTVPPPSFGPKPAAPPLESPAEGTIVTPGARAVPPRTPSTPPSFLRPRPVPNPTTATSASPGSAASGPGATAAPPVAAPATPGPSAAPAVASPQSAKSDKAPTPLDALESLEEEMAKLLGRNMKES